MNTAKAHPPEADLERVFRLKHGDPRTTGWNPRRQFHFGYYTPDDFYEALVAGLVREGCVWVDVGGGRAVFPGNQALARELAGRCALLVGVDPSDTIEENPFLHQRVRTTVEEFRSPHRFDLATLRMVAEHITDPGRAAASLARLVRPGGKVVVYTVNKWSPVSVAAWVTPFWLHHPVKRLLWGTEERDTFPVSYKMNTRKHLLRLFERHGFRECSFLYLDDCRTFYRSKVLNLVELTLWRSLKAAGLKYPENCLLAVYEKTCPA
jgi:SAM-dependent methyltransferase